MCLYTKSNGDFFAINRKGGVEWQEFKVGEKTLKHGRTHEVLADKMKIKPDLSHVLGWRESKHRHCSITPGD